MPDEERLIWLASFARKTLHWLMSCITFSRAADWCFESLSRGSSRRTVPINWISRTAGGTVQTGLRNRSRGDGNRLVGGTKRRSIRAESRHQVSEYRPARQRRRRRFKREGLILGRLAHPHIAQLIDAGVSDTGQPYLILEHVSGDDIDRYCDDRTLDVHSRIRLFLDVLEAVERRIPTTWYIAISNPPTYWSEAMERRSC